MSESTGLVRYDEMCRAIGACHSLDEVKDIHDKARALEVYAKQAMNTDAERQACEVRLRAERKAGEMLAEKKRAPGARNDRLPATVAGGSEYTESLNAAGINERTGQRWQLLAGVPEDEFEQALAAPDKPSTNGIIKRPKAPKMDDDALWLWGRLRDWEKKRLNERWSPDLLSGMTETMQDDCRRIAPMLAEWLGEMK